MKKFFLSVSVVALFAVYSLFKQGGTVTTDISQPTPVTGGGSLPIPTSALPTGAPQAGNTNAVQPTAAPPPPANTPVSRGRYRDGTYTGDTVDAFYGYIQVQAVVQNGKLTDVKILQYPNDRGTSIQINSIALPMLQQEAIQAQSANIDAVSGASDSSAAFIQSLGSALKQAS